MIQAIFQSSDTCFLFLFTQHTRKATHIWGTQDRAKHQNQAGNTAYKTSLATFPNTLTGTKQERQSCFLCCVTHSPTTHTKNKCRQSSNLNNYSKSLPSGLLCSMELMQKSASYQLRGLKPLQLPGLWSLFLLLHEKSWDDIKMVQLNKHVYKSQSLSGASTDYIQGFPLYFYSNSYS